VVYFVDKFLLFPSEPGETTVPLVTRLPRWLLIVASLLLCSCDSRPPTPQIGVLQWSEEVKPYTETHAGLIDGLRDKGYRDGVNIGLRYVNVEQDQTRAKAEAAKLATPGTAALVALGTGSAKAAIEATIFQPIPVVFSIVADPVATGIIRSFADSGGNITGVSMKIDIDRQLAQLEAILGRVDTLGILYARETIQAAATAGEAVQEGRRRGWNVVTSSLDSADLKELPRHVGELARQVDAIYVPTDPVLGRPELVKELVAGADAAGKPLFGVAEVFVEQGFLAALHCDFYQLGYQAANPIAQILKGVEAKDIPSQKPMITRLSLNLNKARQLGIDVCREVIMRADRILE